MLDMIWKFIQPWWSGAAKIALALAAAFGTVKYIERSGANKKAVDDLKDEIEKEGKSRAVAQKEKREVDGLPDSELVDRLRRRGDDWGSL